MVSGTWINFDRMYALYGAAGAKVVTLVGRRALSRPRSLAGHPVDFVEEPSISILLHDALESKPLDTSRSIGLTCVGLISHVLPAAAHFWISPFKYEDCRCRKDINITRVCSQVTKRGSCQLYTVSKPRQNLLVFHHSHRRTVAVVKASDGGL